MDPLLVALSLAAALLFALGLLLSRNGLRHLPAVRGAATSVPTTALLFLVLSPAALPGSGFDLRAAAIFALVGLLYPAAATLLNFEATRRIGPETTGALGNLTPLFAVALAWGLLGDAPRPGQLLALLVIIGGMLLLFGRPWRMQRPAAVALALPLASALLRGMTQPVVKLGLAFWPNPFAAALLGYLVSATLLLLIAHRAGLAPPTPRGAWRGRLLFVAVGVTNGTGLLCLYAALARGPVAVVAPLAACYPLLTLLLGRVLPGRAALPRGAAPGIVVTVAGVWLLLIS